MSNRSRGRGDRGGRGSSSAPRGQGGSFRGGRGRGGPSVAQAFQPSDGARPVPDQSVQNFETRLIPHAKGPVQDLAKLSLRQDTPLRPGYGSRGLPVILRANYFQIVSNAGSILHRYNIDIVPSVENRRLRARLIQLLLEHGSLSELVSGLASDYQATLISVTKLALEPAELTVDYRDEGEKTSAQGAKQYRIRLQETGIFPITEMIDYLTSTNISDAFAEKAPVTQALNIIMNHPPKSKNPGTLSARRNVHFASAGASIETFNLGAGLQVWRGYLTSVRLAASRVLVNVQIKHVSMYKSVRLDELMRDFQQQNGQDPRKIERFIRRVRIERLHLKPRKQGKPVPPKLITGIATTRDGRRQSKPPIVPSNGATARQIQFFLGDNVPSPLQANKYVSVFEYFNKVYNIRADSQLPVINIGTVETPNYLPPEVCFVLPAQPSVTKLSAEQTAQMIRFAVRRPFENAKSISENGLTDLGLKPPNPLLTSFGLEPQPHMLAVNGRILPAPKMAYSGNRTVEPRFGSWNMGSVTFSRGSTLTAWSILWLRSQSGQDPWGGDPNQLVPTLQAFHQRLRECGMQCSSPFLPGANIYVDSDNDQLAIEEGFRKLLSRKRQEKLLLVIMPRHDDNHYNTIKRCGDLDFGVQTICVLASKFAKPNNSQYFANVALKFNLKLGGINQSLPADKVGFIAQGTTMIVGIDVTHPSPGSDSSAPSVAAMVASTSKDLGQFPAVICAQTGRQEMVADLSMMIKTRLSLWRKHNSNRLPENILVYRDGVSEGQYPIVLEKELPLLRKGCRETYPANAKRPAISIVIVSKRHSTRFFITTTDASQIDERSSNPKHGTVVDRGITEPRFWDFYLQAHTALQGTARPAHYFVVHDEILSRMPLPAGFTHAADVLEDITHNLSYMFGRATKAVSYCPAACYADIACERGRCYLSHLFSPTASEAGDTTGQVGEANQDQLVRVHENLRDTMFYI
ncbi:MAG: hypothetical protein M1821_008383 [Bathelium mastoideum]|nr:MAG: hypothetical protein M1821_008383 [Bathelium mastoideum]